MAAVLLALLVGVALAGLWFALTMLISSKTKSVFWDEAGIVLAALPGLAIVPFTGHPLLRVASLGQGRAWLLLAATVALTCLVTLAVPVRAKTGRELLLSGVDGLLMEVPMRWATLPCLWALLSWQGMTAAGPIAVVVTAAVWCVGIVVQAVVTRTLRPRSLVIELLSSCLFSLGVGAVVLQTECILFPMAGHFAERILGYFLRRRFGKTVE